MRNLFVFIFLMAHSLCNAISIDSLWTNIPQHVIPYISHEQRLAMLPKDNAVSGDSIDNEFGEKSYISFRNSKFLQIETSSASTTQLFLLQKNAGDTCICMINTTKDDNPHSRIDFYDTKWSHEKSERYISSTLDLHSISTYQDTKPDTMDIAEYESLVKMMNPVFIQISPQNNGTELICIPCFPFANNEERKKLNSIVKQKNIKWDGKIFK